MDETRRPLRKRERHAVPLTLRFLVRAANLDPFGVVNLGSAGKPKRCHIIDKHSAQLYITAWAALLKFIHIDPNYSKSYFTETEEGKVYGAYRNITRLFCPAIIELGRLGLLSYSKRDEAKLSKSGAFEDGYLALKLINLPDSENEEACLAELARRQCKEQEEIQGDELKSSSSGRLEHPSQTSVDSPFYLVHSELEEENFPEIHESVVLLRIRGHKKMGKTLLMERLSSYASQTYETVVFDIDAHQESLRSSNEFLYALCYEVAVRLGIQVETVKDVWTNGKTSNERFTDYFQGVVFPQLKSPFILFIDNLDQLFSYSDTAKNVLSLLRSIHEATKRPRSVTTWRKVRLVISHSTQHYTGLDLRVSPFNVGIAINLPTLSAQQVQQLVALHGLKGDMQELSNLVGSQPYLMRLGLYYLAKTGCSQDELIRNAFSGDSPYINYLRELSAEIDSNPELKTALAEQQRTGEPMMFSEYQRFQLDSLGVVKLENVGTIFRCKLYEDYFLRVL